MEKSKSILLIEDDRIDIMTVQRGLKKLKVENPLQIKYNGMEALDFLSKSKQEELPGLILLDLNMPKMDGFEFLKRIKETPFVKRIPVIVVTTSDSNTDKASCFDLNVAGYFVKPLDYFSLLDAIVQYWKFSKSPPMINGGSA